ncbi:hypothetical protein IHE61_31070 [Streptomyces sp. GKU 257-1]|nr:hypothetical protein [Streptomyces sp. GKU 257-1]
MTPRRDLHDSAHEGIPATAAVPLALPTTDGPRAALALAATEDVPRDEILAFVSRHQFAPRDQTARAADSQARWSTEPDGRVTFQFVCDDGASRIVIPPDPRVHQWAAMARLGGGTISALMIPGLPSTDTPTIARRLSPHGGEYWHLSVGCIPL